MKNKYLIYLLTLLMALSPAAVFADIEDGAAADPADNAAVTEEAEAAVEAPAEEVIPAQEDADALVPADEEVVQEDAAAEGTEETPTNDWDSSKTHYYKDGVVQTGLFKAPKRTDPSINTMYFAGSDGAIKTVGGPITVTSDMTKDFYRFADKGTTSGYEVQPGETGPLTYFIYTVDGDCDIMPKEDIYIVGSSKYYVKPDGTVRTDAGPQEFKGSKYYVQNGGAILTTVGFTPDHKYYVESADGKLRTAQGTFTANDGRLYYSGAGGEIPSVAGLYAINGTQYYVNADGSVKTDAGFINVNGKKYLVQAGGAIRATAGVVDFGGSKYVALADGSICTTVGFIDAGGKRYYVSNAEGVLRVNKSFKSGGKTYHALADGTIGVGVHKWGKYYYYGSSKGAIRTKKGIVSWSGNRYYVKKGGKITTNKKFKYKGKYYIAAKNGAFYKGIFTWKKNLYYASSKGVLRTKAGVFTANGSRYYSKKGGKLYKNKLFTAGGKKYLAQADGKLSAGYLTWKGKYYLTNSKCVIYTKAGLYAYNGKTYYAKKGGALAINEMIEYKDKHYYCGSDGAIVKKPFTYKGVTLTPDPTTGAISNEEYWKAFPNEAPKTDEE